MQAGEQFPQFRGNLLLVRSGLDGETAEQIASAGRNWDMLENFDDNSPLMEAQAKKEATEKQLGIVKCSNFDAQH